MGRPVDIEVTSEDGEKVCTLRLHDWEHRLLEIAADVAGKPLTRYLHGVITRGLKDG